jgi:hypothetical protein
MAIVPHNVCPIFGHGLTPQRSGLRVPPIGLPPRLKALADVRQIGSREEYCYHHVQAILLTIDQYAESALGNREFFLNKPHGIGGKKDNIP